MTKEVRSCWPVAIAALIPAVLAACMGQPVDSRSDAPDPGDPGGGRPGFPGGPVVASGFLGGPVLHRLTLSQYRNVLSDLLGIDMVPAGLEIDLDARLNGLLSIGSTQQPMSPRATEQMEQVVNSMLTTLFADPQRRMQLVGCDPAQGACLGDFLSRFGRRAWRRPLSADEQRRLVTLAQMGTSKTNGDAWAGPRYAVAALLQSPHFVFRVELGTPDAADASRRMLTAYETASRLSFLLTNGGPDQGLLDAAAANKLGTSVEIEAQAMRLLSGPRAALAVEEFFEDYLNLGQLLQLSKLDAMFPTFNDALKQAMRTETLRTLRTLTFDENNPWASVFTTRSSFLSPELARFYNLARPSASGAGLTTKPDSSPRVGLLTHASLLATNAHASSTSPTLRGKFVRETLLCQSIPAPPDNVDTKLPETSPSIKTTRQKLEAHVADPACAACHQMMDPIGLALENFDAVGQYREDENGERIDTRGDLDGMMYEGPEGLANAVAQHPRLETCLVLMLMRHAAGSAAESSQEDQLRRLLEASAKSQRSSLRGLLLSLATSPAFRHVSALEGAQP